MKEAEGWPGGSFQPRGGTIRPTVVVWHEQTLSPGRDYLLEFSIKHISISGSPDPSVCFVETSGRRDPGTAPVTVVRGNGARTRKSRLLTRFE